MNKDSVKKTVNLDGVHSLEISVCEVRQTVITELVTLDGPPVMIYAEKFDEPCNYFKMGIRRGIEYLNAKAENNSKKHFQKNESFLKNNELN